MRFIGRLLPLTAMATAAALAISAAPASAAIIETGHIHALDVDYVGGVLTLDIQTSNPPNDDVSPATILLRVLPGPAAATVPTSPAWACLGAAGSTFYVLPQTQNTNLLWPGWDTIDVPAAQGPVEMELVGWTTPPGGRFSIYTAAFGAPTFRLNTNSAAGCTITTWPGNIAVGTHGHGNWAFSALGNYTLTFRATAQGGAGATSGNVTYTFHIG